MAAGRAQRRQADDRFFLPMILIDGATGASKVVDLQRREYRKRYKDEHGGKPYRWSGQTKEYSRLAVAKQRRNLRLAVLDAYGAVCVCCGETEEVFLTIDHIDGGGRAHRKQLGSSNDSVYRWLQKNNYPKGFQVLCFNCNCGRAKNGGVCPHVTH